MARRLKRVVLLTGVRGLAALRFDPEEVRPLVARAATGVALSVAAQRLGLAFKVAKQLASPDLGEPILATVSGVDAYGQHHDVRILDEEIARFRSEYITLFELTAETGVHHVALARRLRQAGIEPVVDRRRIPVSLYRRSQVASISLA